MKNPSLLVFMNIKNKVYYFKAIIVVFVFFLASCEESKESIYTKRLTNLIGSQINKQMDVLIIPNEGCGGCISDATLFAKQNYNKKKIIIIFTGVKDKKLLKNIVGEDFLNKERVYVDNQNLFNSYETSLSYPKILKIKRKKVFKILDFENNNLKDN